MAGKNQVTLTFAGETKDLEAANKRVIDDSKKVEKGFDDIGKTSRNLGGDFDNIGKAARRAGDDIGHGGDKFSYAKGKTSEFGGAIGDLVPKMGDLVAMAGGFVIADLVGKGIEKAIEFVGQAVDEFTDLNEAVSKSNEVFSDAGPEIERWAGTLAKSMGLSKKDALLAAGDFGNLFDQMGVGDQAAAMLSQSLIQAAVDLGSFNNADATDVIDDMTAAFRGEYDSIQKYLPMMNAASVEQRALQMTGKKTTDELTAQDKMMAVIAMSTQDLGKAQGDFARTSEGAANAQKIATAEMDNAKALLGEQLMPLQLKWIELQSRLATILTETIIPKLKELGEWYQRNKETVDTLAIALGVGLAIALGLIALALVAVSAPFIALGLVITKVIGPVKDLWHTLEDFWMRVSQGLADNLGRLQGWRDSVQNTLGSIPGFVSSLPGRISSAASGMWNSISNGFKDMINSVIGWWNRLSFTIPKIDIPSVDVPGLGKIGGGSLGGRTYHVPQIGKLHTGGEFSAPAGRQEGLALLLDGEEVTRPGGNAPGGGDTYVINVYGSIRSERDFFAAIEKAIASGRLKVPKGKAA